MKHFLTMTAAAAALCAFAADGWAAPHGGRLELVASTTSDSGTASHHRHKKAEASKTSRSRRSKREAAAGRHGRHHAGETGSETHARRGRHHAAEAETETTHGRRGRHHLAAAEAETAHGRRGRHHRGEEAAAEPQLRGRHGRHRAAEEAAAETPERGRHGRHHKAFRSEIHTEGGASVKVGRRDTLESISRRTGVSIPELARLNGLRRPYHVRLGARLKLPERRYYVVKSGDTLYSVGRKFDVGAAALAEANGVSASHRIRAGQKLFLPSGAVEAAPPEEVAQAERPPRRQERRAPAFSEPFEGAGAQPTPQRPVTIPQGPSPYQPVPPAQQPQPPQQGAELTPPPRTAPYQPAPETPPSGPRPLVQSTPAPNPADVAAAGRGKFVWPVQGQVISGFGHKADGTSNDGLNIAATAGDPVRAAADGEVVYAGDQVPSFGNLVLIKHPGGWVTAYAHMARILVKNRDTVVQGQEIGVVGQTGQVSSPQVHFEIRYAPSAKDKATPVDPALLLPQR